MLRKAQPKSGRAWPTVALGVMAGAQLVCSGQATTVPVTPAADAFVRSVAPGNNYGAAGALSVSGSAAVNGSGQQNGLFDSLLRFPMSGVVPSFDGLLGSNGWVIGGVELVLTEVGAPNNAMFNRGVGALEIRGIGSSAWLEGTGMPTVPTTDGVVYQDLPAVLNPAVGVSLGWFTNSGVNGPVRFPLTLAEALVSNIVAGADVNLYLTAASTSVGFTFNSRNNGASSSWPSLVITAVAKPAPRIGSITPAGMDQVAIRFYTASNWTYAVQGAAGLPAGGVGAWSNLLTIPAQPFDGQAEFVDSVTNRQKYYRLLLSQ